MNISHKLRPLVLQDVHQLSHFAIGVSKNDLLKLLRPHYMDDYLENESFQTLQILAQLHICSLVYEPSNRQKEVQRLWQERGLLERTRANLASCRYMPKNFDNKLALEQAITVVMNLLWQNRYAMETIKQRIPK